MKTHFPIVRKYTYCGRTIEDNNKLREDIRLVDCKDCIREINKKLKYKPPTKTNINLHTSTL